MSKLPDPTQSPNWRPNFAQANYQDPGIDPYRGNPFIEALPQINDVASAAKALASYPPYNPKDRDLPAHLRSHVVENVHDLFVPLDIHIDLEQRISRLIRRGYCDRHPLAADFWTDLDARITNLGHPNAKRAHYPSTASGMIQVGLSGAGKSTSTVRVLLNYQQVIVHQEFRGKPFNRIQISWLMLSCPHNGSTKAICLAFLKAVDRLLGTTYERDLPRKGWNTTEQLIHAMARIAYVHGLGVLVVDEIQHASVARSGGADQLLNFFVELTNEIGIPLIIIGTFKAMGVLCGEFRQIRRGCSEGDMVWTRMENDPSFETLVRGLWKYQYTTEIAPLTKEMIDVLYEVSYGIVDFLVKLFKLAQIRVILRGEKKLTPAIVRSVGSDSIRLAKPVLDALRSGNLEHLRQLDDIQPLDFASAVSRMRKEEVARALSATGQGERGSNSPNVTKLPSSSMEQHPGGTVPVKAAKPLRRRNEQSRSLVPNGLLEIVSKGHSNGQSAYDALNVAGLIRPPIDTLQPEMV